MSISVNQANDVLDVRLGARLTFSDHEDFGDVLTQIEETDVKRIIFDFAETDFIDSSALGMLLIAKDVASDRGAAITLRKANADIRRLFELGSFAEYFEIED